MAKGAVLNQNDLNEIIKSNIENTETIIVSVLSVIDTIGNKKVIDKVKKSSNDLKLITGFVKNYTDLVKSVGDTLSNVKMPKAIVSNLNKSIVVVNKIVSLLSSKEFKALDDKSLIDRVKNTRDVITSISDVYKAITSIIKSSLLILAFGWIIKFSIKVVIWIAKSIIKMSKMKLNKKAIKDFENLAKIINSLYKVMKQLTIMIPLSVLATAGALVSTAFIVILIGFVFVVGLLLKLINRTLIKTEFQLLKIKVIFISLIIIGAAILLFALMTPILVWALAGNIIPFVVFLLASIVILWLILWATSKLTLQAGKEALKTATFVLVIVGLLLVIGIAMLLAGEMGKYLQEEGAILNIIYGLVGVIIVAALVVLLGMALNKAAPFLPTCEVVLPGLALTIGLLVVSGLLLVEFALVGEYLQEDGAIGNIIVGMIAVIIVAALIVLLGAGLAAAIEVIGPCDAGLMLLPVTIGLMIAAGLMIIGLIWIGKQIREGDNIENIIYAIIGTVIVAALIIVLAAVLVLVLDKAAMTTPGLMLLGAVIGTLFISSLMLIGFALIGKQMREEDTIENIGIAILGTVVVAGLCIGLGWALMPMLAAAQPANAGLVLLGVVIGLLFVSALMLIGFAWVGEKINDEDTIVNIGIAIAGTMYVAGIVIALGFALIPMIATGPIAMSGLAALAAALGLLLVAGLAIIALAKIGQELDTPMENGKKPMDNADIALDAIISIGWQLAWLGVQMVVIGVSCILLTAGLLFYVSAMGLLIGAANQIICLGEISIELINKGIISSDGSASEDGPVQKFITGITDIGWRISWLGIQMVPIGLACVLMVSAMVPFLIAIGELVIAAIALKTFGDTEIELSKVNANLDNIGGFWDSFKEFMDHFDLADLLIIPEMMLYSSTITAVTGALQLIVEQLKLIQEITLDYDKIIKNVDEIFKFINKLSEHINKLLTPDEKEKEEGLWGTVKSWFNRIEQHIEREYQHQVAIDKLNKVEQICTVLNTIANTLNELQKISLDGSAILNNVKSIFEFMDYLAEFIKNSLIINSDLGFNNMDHIYSAYNHALEHYFPCIAGEFHIKTQDERMVDRMNTIEVIAATMGTIAKTLNDIAKIKINKEKITENVSKIFSFIKDLADQIELHMSTLRIFEDKIEYYTDYTTHVDEGIFTDDVTVIATQKTRTVKNKTPETMSNVDKIFVALLNIVTTLDAIKGLALDEDSKTLISNNIAAIFEFVKDICAKMEETLKDPIVERLVKTTIEASDSVGTGISGFNFGISSAEKESKNTKLSITKVMDVLSTVFGHLKSMTESLQKVKELNVGKDDGKLIHKNINSVLSIVNVVAKVVEEKETELMKAGVIFEALPAMLEEYVSVMDKLTESFESFGKVDTGSFNRATNSFKSLVATIANVNENKATTATAFVDSLSDLTSQVGYANKDSFSSLSNFFKECTNFSKSNIGNLKNGIKECGEFVNKVKSIEVTKLKAATNLFRQMCEFSNSISGNFDRLAEALGEKLLPVLEELKEVMTEIPEKIDESVQGINNTENNNETIVETRTGFFDFNKSTSTNSNKAAEAAAREQLAKERERERKEARLVMKIDRIISLLQSEGIIVK